MHHDPTHGRSDDSAPVRVFWDGDRDAPDGWIGAARPTAADLLGDGLDFESASIDRVYVGPALGEVDSWKVVDLLREFRRVLRGGGVIRLAVFDLDRAIEAYRSENRDFFWDRSTDHLSGAFAVQLLHWGSARALFTPALLEEHLVRAGFTDPRRCRVGSSYADPVLAAPDRLGDHLCYVEAGNPDPWPGASVELRPSGVHLSWGDARCTTVGVTWFAPAGSRGSLRYRVHGTAAWAEVDASSRATVDGPISAHVFQAPCTGLEPDTRYEYEVVQYAGRQDASGGVDSFSTLPDDPHETIAFAFVADSGLAGRLDGLCDGISLIHEAIEHAAPDFVLGGGDYAYKSSDSRMHTGQQAVQAWLEQISPIARRCPLMLQWGNHEVELGEFLRDWNVHFSAPGVDPATKSRCYSFDAGPCHVSAFYAPTADIDPVDLSWLWQDLSDARARGCPWLVVFQHQPLFAHGSSHPADPRVARALGKVLLHHHVDLHLSAHDQNYERSYPLTWSGTEPTAATTSPSRYQRGEGTIFAKVSPGGKRSDIGQTFSRLRPDGADLIARSHDDAHHLAVVEYDESRLELTVHGASVDWEGTRVIDHVVITDSQ